MTFLSLQPFVPSGKDFESAKEFFQQLGFNISWDAGDYVGFVHEDSFGEKNGCRFILQNFDNKEFAENFMITVNISNVEEFWKMVNTKGLPDKFGVRITAPKQMPYGKESNLIDLAGVCWHFVE